MRQSVPLSRWDDDLFPRREAGADHRDSHPIEDHSDPEPDGSADGDARCLVRWCRDFWTSAGRGLSDKDLLVQSHAQASAVIDHLSA